MALRRRSGHAESLSAWPGYVDALSTLLMVIIFVLLVFVLAQAFLSVTLTGRDQALDRARQQMAQLSDMLALERGHAQDMQTALAQLNRDLASSLTTRDSLSQQLANLKATQDRLAAERDSLRGQRDALNARLADSTLQMQSANGRAAQYQSRLADATSAGDAATQEAAATRQQLADMQAQMAELNKTVTADRATIQARLSDLAGLSEQVKALTALRDQLEAQAQSAAANAMTEAQKRAAVQLQLSDEKKLGDSARAQIALLNQQLDQLRAQLAGVSQALDASEKTDHDKDVQITNLGARLNAALAQRVEELQQYRSEFFGELRKVLAGRPGITVVGDRFVFQSEVLFPVGGADLSPEGTQQIEALGQTLLEISKQIPQDVNWLLRVDGHADRQPVLQTARFASNWELSAARAITVVKLLVAQGIPANRLAATGFGDNQPLDPADTPAAYAKNRRIEIRLTDR